MANNLRDPLASLALHSWLCREYLEQQRQHTNYKQDYTALLCSQAERLCCQSKSSNQEAENQNPLSGGWQITINVDPYCYRITSLEVQYKFGLNVYLSNP